MLKDWIIGVSGSDMDDVVVYKFTGTDDDAGRKLLEMVNHDRGCDPDNWDFGTENAKDVSVYPNGKLYAYGCYSNCHIDYTATPIENILAI